MNAIIPAPTRDEERNARHRRNCQRLAELAMKLSEAAAARALTQLETEPASADSQTPADPATPRRPMDPILTFVRLASAARQAMAHEARIDAAEDAAQSGQPFHHFPAGEDLRAPLLAPIIRQAAAAQPNRPGLAEEAADLLDTLIVIDIDGTTPAASILATVCRDCRLQPDYTLLAPELLDTLFPDGPPLSATIWRPPDD